MIKPHLRRSAKLAATAVVALAMAVAMIAAPAGAAQSTAASDQVTVSFERLAAPAEAHAGAPALAQQQAMIIQVANGTDLTFDEVALFFTRFSDPLAERQSRFNVGPGQSVAFTLADCGDIDQYAIGIFVDGELILNTENIIPDRELCFENIGII